MIQVTLDPYEKELAKLIGKMRRSHSKSNGYKARYGAPKDGKTALLLDVEGAAGEMAVAKYLGVFYNGTVGQYDRPDVAGLLEVRTRSRHDYDLIVHPKEKDAAPFVLVTGSRGQYVIRGWIYGINAKDPIYWKDPTGNNRWAYFVPQADLWPIQELLRFYTPPSFSLPLPH